LLALRPDIKITPMRVQRLQQIS